jgi:TrkA domain protein
MEIREVELPGVGRKYAVRTDEGERLTVIVHATGQHEVYLFQGGSEFPTAAVRLGAAEAAELGAILRDEWRAPNRTASDREEEAE